MTCKNCLSYILKYSTIRVNMIINIMYVKSRTPQTPVGRIFGSICAICGILTIAMPLAIISNNFMANYEENKRRKHLTKIYSEPKMNTNKNKMSEVNVKKRGNDGGDKGALKINLIKNDEFK